MNTSLADQARDAASLIERLWPRLQERAADTIRSLPARPRTVLICGCGDSYHASDSLSYAFRGWARVSALGAPAMQLARYLVPEISRPVAEVLVIGISASGETARTLEALELARERGLHTLAITCQDHSTLASMAEQRLSTELPDYPTGPGLASYLVNLLAGMALAAELSTRPVRSAVGEALGELPGLLARQLEREWPAGTAASEQIEDRLPVTFLGSGPTYGPALFAAAKLIEAAGWPAWAQETEEWAHVEYFADPPELPVWLLSAAGRTAGREAEVEQAAKRLGRRLLVSRWGGDASWPAWARETLSPLALWVGPTALAEALMQRSGESPFREFAGGRSTVEGGGANRVRSSRRLASLKDLEEFQPGN